MALDSKTVLLLLLNVCLFNIAAASETASWYDQKLEGWYYFEDRKETSESQADLLDNATNALESEKTSLKSLLSAALLNPSADNVEKYIRAQKRWVNQSAKFADVWGKILLEKPFLGDFLENPTTSYGILAKRDLDLKQRKTFLQSLSKTCFFLFFFRGNDPLSERAAEVASLFAELNNWTIKAVSLDGVGVKGINLFEADKGIGEILRVQVAPSFYVVNPFENKAFPVGAGLLSVSDIERNIELQLGIEEQNE